jgi:hypothetical protein
LVQQLLAQVAVAVENATTVERLQAVELVLELVVMAVADQPQHHMVQVVEVEQTVLVHIMTVVLVWLV